MVDKFSKKSLCAMERLNLPPYDFRISKKAGKQIIFDDTRKKFVALTPEEWVRQNIVKYLVEGKHYPPGLIRVEGQFRINNVLQRSDILVFDRQGLPFLMVECKAPSVKISQSTFNQITRYAINWKVKYLMVTNGIQHYCCQYDETTGYSYLESIPEYSS